jgi:hypothetical protein
MMPSMVSEERILLRASARNAIRTTDRRSIALLRGRIASPLQFGNFFNSAIRQFRNSAIPQFGNSAIPQFGNS